MIEFKQAQEIIINSAKTIGTENVDFIKSLNSVTAEDIISDINMPPFNKSAVDGYAYKITDFNKELKVIETIPAGMIPNKVISDDECSKIMTGAMIPDGADMVVMVEDTINANNNKIRIVAEKAISNICYKAEDVKKGDIVIKKGNLITAEHIPIMATVGCTNPLVYKKPNIGIISTGNELVEPNEHPALCKIRNVNSYQLMAQCCTLGISSTYYGIANDDEVSSEKIIRQALEKNDIVLISGGVSMGDYDFIPSIIKKIGVNILFQSIAVQPGKPTMFGTLNDNYIFGLPGNPVSAFIQFELLVKDLIYKIMGRCEEQKNILLPFGIDYHRKKSSRLGIIPIKLNSCSEVIPIEYHGSAHISSLIDADGLTFIEKDKFNIYKGELVNVRFL